jgi:hypothetical protein
MNLLALIDHFDHGLAAAVGAAVGIGVAHVAPGRKPHKYGFGVATAIIIGVAIGWITKHTP